ncbi:MAG: DUF2950 family protein [Syntrophobacteraceae bacterium]|jgi:hypothetical protein
MLLFNKNRGIPRVFLFGSAICLMAFLVSVWFCGNVSAFWGGPIIVPSDAYKNVQNTYRSPEDAVAALVGALNANDENKLLAVLGSKGKKFVFSGDEGDQKAACERFVQAYQEKNRIIKVSSKEAVLEIGNEDRPFPIRIEKVDNRWHFSAKRGRVELLKPPDQQK